MDTIKIDARDVNFWYGDFHALIASCSCVKLAASR